MSDEVVGRTVDPIIGDERDVAAKSTNKYLRSDLGNAELLADRHAHRLRHISDRGAWIVCVGGRWRPDRTGEAERAAKSLARERLREAASITKLDLQKDAVSWAMVSQSDSRIKAALSLARTESKVVLLADDLDRDPFLLGCGNGTVDLRTGDLRSARAEDLITLGTDVPYDPDATCPRWDMFLNEVFDGDSQLIEFMQRLTGYSVTGDVREQIVPVLYGGGGNGKDTMLKPIQQILGDYAVTASMETFTRSPNKGVRNDLARLHRARMVIASESAEGRNIDEPTIKAISGGNRIASRFLYKEHFEYTPQFKVWLVTNYRPRVNGDDDAIWRRLRLIPFNVSFVGREDKMLAAKLEAELPGIFAWAVRGCLAWQVHGLGLPAAVENATSEYRRDEDTLGAFLSERCCPGGAVAPADLRAAYEKFCAEVNEQPLAQNMLGKRLVKRGYRRGGRDSLYQGLTLR